MGIAAGLVLAALLGLLVYGLATREPLTAESGSQRPGKPAPLFALRTFDGGEVRLQEFRGRPVVVNFWASWCAPCRVEMPHLTEAYRRHREEGVVFIGINIQDTRQNAEEFLRDFDVPEGYLIVTDVTGQVTVDYGVAGLPATFFIDRAGIVRKRWVGALDARILEEQIAVISAS
ncbi:MAG: TlpA family protein disulfide reductase [Chloroflexi bacterium]|nr:TlpA family protein disulfide reductase [Chloroflexota bacterium]